MKWQLVIILFCLVVGGLVFTLLQKQQSMRVGANTYQATLYLSPTTQTEPPSSVYQLWYSSTTPVAFVHADIIFDPTLLKLVQNVNVSTALSKVITNTPATQANTNGRISLTLGFDPALTNGTTPPSGNVKLAEFTLAPNTTAFKMSEVIIDPQTIQLVHPDKTVITTTLGSTRITLNPTPSPITITPRPSASPKPSLLSCIDVCQNNQRTQAACRKNSSRCYANGERPYSSGNAYCKSVGSNVCCCK